MKTVVVDTNVAIVANGRATHADAQCRLTCVERLLSVIEDDMVAIDEDGHILDEYGRHLSHSGAPGVGDAFFKHVFDYQYQSRRVRRVVVTLCDDQRRGFQELPQNTFDPSDRKFLAVAVTARAVVLNATDSDWCQHKKLMNTLNVKVCQLCPQHASK